MIDLTILSELAKTDPKAFEEERNRIIKAHLNAMPEETRPRLVKYQSFIDEKRKELSPSEFLEFLIQQAKENIDY